MFKAALIDKEGDQVLGSYESECAQHAKHMAVMEHAKVYRERWDNFMSVDRAIRDVYDDIEAGYIYLEIENV